jgi:hypothetical protein
VVNGLPADLLRAYRIIGAAGAGVLSGVQADLTYTPGGVFYVLTAGPGGMTLAGATATLTKGAGAAPATESPSYYGAADDSYHERRKYWDQVELAQAIAAEDKMLLDFVTTIVETGMLDVAHQLP